MPTSKYLYETKINLRQGGTAALGRLVEAYSFTTRQALADHLGVSKNTLANRYMKDTFSANWMIQCALDTNVSLRWLATSEGPMRIDTKTQIMSFAKQKYRGVKLRENGNLLFDLMLLPKDLNEIPAIKIDDVTYLIKHNSNEINDGLQLISIDDIHYICELIRLPNNRVMLYFSLRKSECYMNHISIIAKVIIACK